MRNNAVHPYVPRAEGTKNKSNNKNNSDGTYNAMLGIIWGFCLCTCICVGLIVLITLFVERDLIDNYSGSD